MALAAVAPVRNYDSFWHLATGRWIVEHRALPLQDPFAVASDRTEWINGEWLFETVAYAQNDDPFGISPELDTAKANNKDFATFQVSFLKDLPAGTILRLRLDTPVDIAKTQRR